MSTNYLGNPWGFIFPAIALIGLIGVGYFNFRQRDLASFISSCAFIVGMLASVAFGLYPLLLPAVNRGHSLSIFNTSASPFVPAVCLDLGVIGIIRAILFFPFLYSYFWGEVFTVCGDQRDW